MQKGETRGAAEWRCMLGLIKTSLNIPYEAVDEPIDWPHCWALCQWHRVDALVGTIVSQLPLVPDTISKLASGAASQCLHNNMSLLAYLTKIQREFAKESIDYLILKGPTLAVMIPDGLASRQMRDLDILISKKQLPKALAVLSRLGFQQQEKMTELQFSALIQTNKEIELTCSGFLIELHWRLSSFEGEFSGLSTEGLLAQAELVAHEGLVLPQMPLHEMLVYLCFHGSSHSWFRLFWLLDIFRMMQNEGTMTVNSVYQYAVKLQQSRSLVLSWVLLHKLFDWPMPPSRVIPSRTLTWANKKAGRIILNLQKSPFDTNLAPKPMNAGADFMTHIALESGVIRKVRVAYHRLVHLRPADIAWVRLPKWAFPLYFLLRPVRLILKRMQSS